MALAEEHVHVVVRIGELRDNAFMATRVGSVRRVVCASPDLLARRGTPRTPEELRVRGAITIGGFAETLVWPSLRDGKPLAARVHPRVDQHRRSCARRGARRVGGDASPLLPSRRRDALGHARPASARVHPFIAAGQPRLPLARPAALQGPRLRELVGATPASLTPLKPMPHARVSALCVPQGLSVGSPRRWRERGRRHLRRYEGFYLSPNSIAQSNHVREIS